MDVIGLVAGMKYNADMIICGGNGPPHPKKNLFELERPLLLFTVNYIENKDNDCPHSFIKFNFLFGDGNPVER